MTWCLVRNSFNVVSRTCSHVALTPLTSSARIRSTKRFIRWSWRRSWVLSIFEFCGTDVPGVGLLPNDMLVASRLKTWVVTCVTLLFDCFNPSDWQLQWTLTSNKVCELNFSLSSTMTFAELRSSVSITAMLRCFLITCTWRFCWTFADEKFTLTSGFPDLRLDGPKMMLHETFSSTKHDTLAVPLTDG